MNLDDLKVWSPYITDLQKYIEKKGDLVVAMIRCPECGNDVSDKAQSCPNCGCPVEVLSPNGTVKIKVSVLKASSGYNGNQKVSILSDGNILWKGNAGEIAEVAFEEATNVTVRYHLSLMHYGGECSGTVDPAKSKKYNISARQGIMSTKLVLQPVDVFNAD